MEIGDMGLQIFDISKQILSGEEINIDLLVGLIKPSQKSKQKKLENIGKNSISEQIKETFVEISQMKENIMDIYEKFKGNINEIYDVYVKKCGENCNIQ